MNQLSNQYVFSGRLGRLVWLCCMIIACVVFTLWLTSYNDGEVLADSPALAAISDGDGDNDGIPDEIDPDSDNDGLPDAWADDGAVLQPLPVVPSVPLSLTRPVTELGLRYDRLEASTTPLTTTLYDEHLCDVSRYWDGERVQVGGRASGNGDEVCKVQLRSEETPALRFLTKWPINHIHWPLTPQPASARFRFPIPQEHEAVELEYEVAWYKLFGSEPDTCHPNEIDPDTGACQLDVSDDWQEGVAAGLYLLWAAPGDAHFTVTGPHEPIQKIGYSGTSLFKASVPPALQQVDELVVALLTYNQYTRACERDNPARCTTHENENLDIHSVALKTAKPFAPLHQPATGHPRLLGDNAQWLAYMQPFEDLPCIDSPSDFDWGGVTNMKNVWDSFTKGGTPCKGNFPSSLTEVSDASFYLNPSPDGSWNRERALRMLHLLRQLKHCHATGGSCFYSAAETQALQDGLISYEMERFETVSWDWGYTCFDLGTEPPMKFWSLFVDVLWDDLSAAQKAAIEQEMSERIDCFLQNIEQKHWSIFNGNNWTPVLAKGAIYWAITYYYEDARAPTVLRETLHSLWLHRDFYLADGAYMEGIVEYTNVSYSNLREINNLLRQAFGVPLESVDWERTGKTAHWYLDFMAPDGQMVDFGDSWNKRGWYTFDPLHMLLWQEMIGEQAVGSVSLDACLVREYFSNRWFYRGLDDPWSIQPSLARDWQAIVEQCQPEEQRGTEVILFEQGQTGALRTYLPGTSPLPTEQNLRFEQGAQTYLAASAIPADFPHRELDFGALIWSAYGNRLLVDFGYGEIGKHAQGQSYLIEKNGLELYDNLALGANTLVVEDATQSGYSEGNYDNDTINSSQIYGERGSIEEISLVISPTETLSGLHLDAGAVYGANDAELGWLRYFDRWLISLDEGNYLVIDAFAVKDERGSADVQEYWHTSAESEPIDSCTYTYENVALLLEDSHTVQLTPQCSILERYADSTVSARLHAASLQAGEFTIEPDIIQYSTRIGSQIERQRIRYQPLNPVSEDIRVFLLQAAPNREANGRLPANGLAPVQLQQANCSDAACFDLTIGTTYKRISFTRTENRYHLNAITASSEPLAIQLATFTATQEGQEVVVRWETVSELDTLGFNLYRTEVTGTSEVPVTWTTALNSTLIPSQAPGSGQGSSYEWVDVDAQTSSLCYYWLEDVDVNGERRVHGPVSVTVNVPTAVTIASFTSANGSLLGGLIVMVGLMGLWIARRGGRREQ